MALFLNVNATPFVPEVVSQIEVHKIINKNNQIDANIGWFSWIEDEEMWNKIDNDLIMKASAKKNFSKVLNELILKQILKQYKK